MIQKLIQKIQETNAPICVGLDPTLSMIPQYMKDEVYQELGKTKAAAAELIFRFNKEIVDQVYDLIPAVKPQIAMYETFGVEGLMAYQKTVDYCKQKGLIVIGDIKRGDIGSTSAAYALGHIGTVDIDGEKTKGFDTDFITVNPYMGTDCVKPFIDICNQDDAGLFVLVKTSNPSSGEFQDQLIDHRPLYEWVGEKVNEWAATSMEGNYSNIGAVVGATYPQMGKALRKLMPKSFILVPGYGAQGGSGKDLVHFFNEDGLGAIVNSSRGIIAAYQLEKYQHFSDKEFALASRQAVVDMIEDIRSHLQG